MNIKALAASALVATTALMGGIAPAEAASLRDQAIVVVDHYAAQSNREFEAEDWTAFCRSEGTQFYVDAMYGMSSTLGRGYKAQTENNIRICKEEGYSVSPWPRAQWPIDIRPQSSGTWTAADDAAFGTNFTGTNNSSTASASVTRADMMSFCSARGGVKIFNVTAGSFNCQYPAGNGTMYTTDQVRQWLAN